MVFFVIYPCTQPSNKKIFSMFLRVYFSPDISIYGKSYATFPLPKETRIKIFGNFGFTFDTLWLEILDYFEQVNSPSNVVMYI